MNLRFDVVPLALLALCAPGSLTLAQCPASDAFEPNDTCASAALLSQGTIQGTSQAGNEDWYRVTLQPHERLRLSLDYAPGFPQWVTLEIGTGCTLDGFAPLTFSGSATQTRSNNTESPLDYEFRVRHVTGNDCVDYSLSVVIEPAAPCYASNDALEPNDTPQTAFFVNHPTSLPAIAVSASDTDWFRFTVPSGRRLSASFAQQLNWGAPPLLRMWNADTSIVLSQSNFNLGNSVYYENIHPESVDVLIEASFLQPTGCCSFNLTSSDSDANSDCIFFDDALEPNDVCEDAILLGPGAYVGSIARFFPDYFQFDVAPGDVLRIDLTFDDPLVSFSHMDSLMYSSTQTDCASAVSGGTLTFSTGIRTFYERESDVGSTPRLSLEYDQTAGLNGCGEWTMTVAQFPDPCLLPDDPFEPNDSCTQTAPLPLGTTTGMSITNQDWFDFVLDTGHSLTVSVDFDRVVAQLDFNLHDECPINMHPIYDPNIIAESVETQTGRELTYRNETGAPQFVLLNVADDPNLPGTCNAYDLSVRVDGPARPFCFGDGGDQMGCTDCPCGNNAPPGSAGGCLNESGESAVAETTGFARVTDDTLRITARGANPNTFAVLTSGLGAAPGNPANPCFGLDSGLQSFAFNGLRCVVQQTQRHGSRAIDSNGEVGVTTPAWGGENGPSEGLVAQGGYAPGQTIYWYVTYRESAGALCGAGQGSTNGLEIPVLP